VNSQFPSRLATKVAADLTSPGRRFRVAWLLCVALLLPLIASAQSNLPDMGEPADTALSPRQENDLGARFMRQIRAGLPLVRDMQLEEYLQTLGQKLALASGKTEGRELTFFIIDDPSINEFAIPGGYVGINTGLVQSMQVEEQLASALAHEVAHVTQRHHARAATQQSIINFPRTNEIEADRIGIEILTNANYDPRAMGETFTIMQRKNRLNTSAGQLEYLRTHPLDNNRIAEANDRATSTQLKRRQQQGDSVIERVDTTDFALFKARLTVNTTADRSQLQRTNLARFKQRPKAAEAYALALLSLQGNRLKEASGYIDVLTDLAGGHLMTELLRADWLAASRRDAQSIELLRSLQELYPDRYSVVEKLIDQLTRARQLGSALSVAQRYLRSSRNPM